MKLKLKAQVSRSEAQTIRGALKQLDAKGSVRKTDDGFVVEAEMEGTSAKEMNRALLSALRKVEKKATIRAEWTSGDNITESFFDYVLKKTVRN
jgi:phosphoribosylformylglycinamidine (FGAM) synthase PurS component